MATHFSILAWRIPWTEESGGLQSWTQLSDWACTHTHCALTGKCERGLESDSECRSVQSTALPLQENHGLFSDKCIYQERTWTLPICLFFIECLSYWFSYLAVQCPSNFLGQDTSDLSDDKESVGTGGENTNEFASKSISIYLVKKEAHL